MLYKVYDAFLFVYYTQHVTTVVKMLVNCQQGNIANPVTTEAGKKKTSLKI